MTEKIEFINGIKFVETEDPNPLCGNEILQNRLNICSSCKFNEKDIYEDNICTKCGCFIKVKTAYQQNQCPIGLW